MQLRMSLETRDLVSYIFITRTYVSRIHISIIGELPTAIKNIHFWLWTYKGQKREMVKFVSSKNKIQIMHAWNKAPPPTFIHYPWIILLFTWKLTEGRVRPMYIGLHLQQCVKCLFIFKGANRKLCIPNNFGFRPILID